jgi:N-methylhydantoinase A
MTTDQNWWVGIDVGGTFTDLVAVHRASGQMLDTKVLTTRPNQEDGVAQALEKIGIPIESVREIVHGHTTGINAVLSRQGTRTALLATAGHRDLLDIGRMDREFGHSLYDPTWLRPHQDRPIAQRRDRYGIRERIDSNGAVLLELDEDQVRDVCRDLRDKGIESVAICFLNAYVSRVHEERVAEIVREECPGVYIQTSELYPVTKEHERTTTVVFDAYVGPVVTRYLERLETRLGDIGFTGTLWIMTMNGGVGSVAETSKAPVFQLVSGPVGGVSGVVDLVRTRGRSDHFVSMDVGGTSTDIAAVQDGVTPMTDLWTIEHGLVMTMPAVDVRSVGSGAGSLISVDHVGSLHVGPASAGSVPGPASYGRGGTEPTLTDACAHLGILPPDLFASGDIQLRVDLATEALSQVGSKIGMTATELADGAYRLASTDMASAIRSISTHRGLDPREFSLLAFGAAGPMMAVPVARELGMKSVVIPHHPGEFSAYGLIASDLRVTRAKSPFLELGSATGDDLEGWFLELEASAYDDLKREGVPPESVVIERNLFAMYSGQTWDNRLSIENGAIDKAKIDQITRQIHDFYIARYGFSAEELGILITTVEVTASAVRFSSIAPQARKAGKASILRTARIRLGGQDYPDVPVHDRDLIDLGTQIHGPAIIVERYATTVLDAASVAEIDAHGNLDITLNEFGGNA